MRSDREERRVQLVAARDGGARRNLSKEVHGSLKEHFGEQLFKTVIPETVRLREAPSFGQSIFDYDPYGPGAKAYEALVDEVMAWQPTKRSQK